MADVGKVLPHGVFPARPVSGKTAGAPRPSPPGEAGYGQQALQGGVSVGLRVEVLNEALAGLNVRLRFKLVEAPGTTHILVVDAKTGEVIKEIPPDYFLGASTGLAEEARTMGLLIDEGV
jgi:hypothetical protein